MVSLYMFIHDKVETRLCHFVILIKSHQDLKISRSDLNLPLTV